MTFVFSALLEYALVNYASRSDAQRLARRKHQKQWELDHCAFDPEHMEDSVAAAAANNGGGSFAMVNMFFVVFAQNSNRISYVEFTHLDRYWNTFCEKNFSSAFAFLPSNQY